MSGQKGRGHQAKFWCTGTRTLVPYSSFGHCHHQMIAAGRRKETKRRSLAGKGGELLICPLVDGARLSSLGVKGKVRTVVKFWFFYIVDHLLMRSLWLE